MAIRRRSPRAVERSAEHPPRRGRGGGGTTRSVGRAALLLAVVVPFLAAVPAAAQPAAPAVATTGHVALTFDDGPGPVTGRVLDVLAARGARATFFVIGDEIPRFPAVFDRILAEGHEVANHTTSHPNLVTLLGAGRPADRAAVRAQIAGAQRAVTAAGAPTPTLFRPPYGATNATINGIAEKLGLRLVLWNADVVQDYSAPVPGGAGTVCSEIVAEAQAGGVVLLHDWNVNTANALGCIIDGVRAKGLEPGRIVPSDTVLPGVGAVQVVPWD
jgi:peptidoglycan-N-acetylglucosamine deacetylase